MQPARNDASRFRNTPRPNIEVNQAREAVRRLAGRTIDAVLFTSSIQLDHLFQIAEEMGIASEVRDSLACHAAIASVGPIMTEALLTAGLPADIIPVHPKMAGLVKASAEQSASVVARKRAVNR